MQHAQKDTLRLALDQLEHECQTKAIPLFYGTLEAPDLPLVQWEEKQSSDWQQYLAVFKSAGAPLLILSTIQNELEEEEEALIRQYADTLTEEDQESFNQSLQTVQALKGGIVSFTLCFVQAGVAYQYETYAEWSDHYYTVQEALMEQGDPNDCEAESHPQLVEEHARRIIAQPAYLATKDVGERRNTAARLLQDHAIEDRTLLLQIQQKVESLFQQEVQPQREQELKQQVQELKAKGLKKIEVKGRLGISTTTLNKLWY